MKPFNLFANKLTRIVLSKYSYTKLIYSAQQCPYNMKEQSRVPLSRQSGELYEHKHDKYGRIAASGGKWALYEIPLVFSSAP